MREDSEVKKLILKQEKPRLLMRYWHKKENAQVIWEKILLYGKRNSIDNGFQI